MLKQIMKYFFFKRFFDILFSFLIIFLLMPIFIIIAIKIKLSSPGPVLYKAIRTGKNNTRFNIYKFRTMVNNADKIGGFSTALNDNRLTKFAHTSFILHIIAAKQLKKQNKL